MAGFVRSVSAFGEAGATGEVASINSQLRSKGSELRSKSDQLLAVMTEIAGDAAVSATTARNEADEAKASAKTAGELATSAKSDVRDARQESARLKEENAELANDLLSTKNQLEALDAKRAELEKSIAPRRDLAYMVAHGKSNLDGLKAFAGIEVILNASPAAKEDAHKILNVVTSAYVNWTVVSRGEDSSIRPGVAIWRHLASDISGFRDADELRSQGAAEALCSFLQSFDWGDCRIEMGSRAKGPLNVPPNTLKVEVGVKPNPYFTPPWSKPIDPNKPLKQQMDEQKKALQEEIERHVSPP